MNKEIADRLKHVLQLEGMNTSQASQKTGIDQPNLSKMLNGKRPIGINMIERIAMSFGISKEWLTTGEGEMYVRGIDKLTQYAGKLPTVRSIFEEGKQIKEMNEAKPMADLNYMEVPFVPVHAQAGYPTGYGDMEYIDSLPTIPVIVDKTYKGKYRVFEAKGDSMDDDTRRAIWDRDRLLCREVARIHWKYKLHIHDWVFVIVHKHKGITIKEITHHDVEKGIIHCKPWNPLYEEFDLNLDDVAELYNVIELLNRSMRQ